jgi:hypothetical protein
MIAIYFPFTFVRPETAWIGSAFTPLCLAVPAAAQAADCLGPGIDSGSWRILSPPREDDPEMQRMEAELRRWAEVHAGADLAALLASRPEGAGFFGLPPASRLRQDIRARVQGQTGHRRRDPLWTARIFLRFAHGLDRERADLAGAWHSLAAMEAEMMRDLHGRGEDGEPGPPNPAVEDPGAFLTGHRLAAWARLCLSLTVAPELLVTDSPAVLETVGEIFPALRPLFLWPAAQDRDDHRHWGDRLRAAVEAAWPPGKPPSNLAPAAPARLQVSALDLGFDAFCRILTGEARPSPWAPPSTGRLLIVGPAG